MKWRLLTLLVLGIFLVAGAIAYRTLWLARPVGQGPAGPAVSGDSFTKPWTTRPVLLLGVGDSITAGYGVRASHSYFGRLVRNPQDEFADMRGKCLSAVLPNLREQNLAVSGSTSIHHLDILQERLEEQDADTLGLIVMTSGGNDLIHNYGRTPPREGAMYGSTLAQAQPWIDNFRERLGGMLDLLEAKFPGGCHIFLADVYDPTDGVADAQNAGLPRWPEGLAVHGAYNDVIRQIAAKRPNVHLVPLHGEFLGHGIHCRQSWREHYRPEDPHYWYAENLEDPNIRGYDAIRRLFLIEMSKVAADLPDGKPVESR